MSNLLEENEILRIQNDNLVKYIKDLENKLDSIKPIRDSLNDKSLYEFEQRLESSIKKLVDDILENDSVNSSIIPDYIEKKIYNNIFTILIGLLKELLETTVIKIFNQNISLKINPQ